MDPIKKNLFIIWGSILPTVTSSTIPHLLHGERVVLVRTTSNCRIPFISSHRDLLKVLVGSEMGGESRESREDRERVVRPGVDGG